MVRTILFIELAAAALMGSCFSNVPNSINFRKMQAGLKCSISYHGFERNDVLDRRYFPSLNQIRDAIPPKALTRSTLRSMTYASLDILGTFVCALIGIKVLLPLFGTVFTSLWSIIGWSTYAVITGTVATGMWVTAHECGHGAFSNNKILQDIIGFMFHSFLLVPYFSWQRSHALHHAFTNHIDLGETHVPPRKVDATPSGKRRAKLRFGSKFGALLFGVGEISKHLLFGWPAYLLFGASGGPSRGMTNHFIPWALDGRSHGLFTPSIFNRVLISDIGVVTVIAMLAFAALKIGLAAVLSLYVGPLIVVNAWLVLYTWLQHTDEYIPHLDSDGHSFTKGAFHTVDRPYGNICGGLIDFLHHSIGSTHVVHHLDSSIPHYNAREATDAIRQRFPDLYLFDPTPIPLALWRVATKCYEVEPISTPAGEKIYVFSDES